MTPGERSEIEKVLKKMEASGLTFQVDYGEGTRINCKTAEQALQHLGECDEEWLNVYRTDGSRLGQAFLVYGNAEDGSEIFADYHTCLGEWID